MSIIDNSSIFPQWNNKVLYSYRSAVYSHQFNLNEWYSSHMKKWNTWQHRNVMKLPYTERFSSGSQSFKGKCKTLISSRVVVEIQGVWILTT